MHSLRTQLSSCGVHHLLFGGCLGVSHLSCVCLVFQSREAHDDLHFATEWRIGQLRTLARWEGYELEACCGVATGGELGRCTFAACSCALNTQQQSNRAMMLQLYFKTTRMFSISVVELLQLIVPCPKSSEMLLQRADVRSRAFINNEGRTPRIKFRPAMPWSFVTSDDSLSAILARARGMHVDTPDKPLPRSARKRTASTRVFSK